MNDELNEPEEELPEEDDFEIKLHSDIVLTKDDWPGLVREKL